MIKPHLFLHITQQQNHLQSLTNEEKQTTKVKEKQQKMLNIFKWRIFTQEHKNSHKKKTEKIQPTKMWEQINKNNYL